MEEKLKAGLANQVFDELGSIKDLRETFIHSNASDKHVKIMENIMNQMFNLYLELTQPAGKDA